MEEEVELQLLLMLLEGDVCDVRIDDDDMMMLIINSWRAETALCVHVTGIEMEISSIHHWSRMCAETVSISTVEFFPPNCNSADLLLLYIHSHHHYRQRLTKQQELSLALRWCLVSARYSWTH